MTHRSTYSKSLVLVIRPGWLSLAFVAMLVSPGLTHISAQDKDCQHEYHWLEAECGDIVAPGEVSADSEASDSGFLATPVGSGRFIELDAGPLIGTYHYTLDYDCHDFYYLWARVRYDSFQHNSFWVAFDHSSDFPWRFRDQLTDQWHWQRLGSISGLSSGDHTLYLKLREEPTQVDKFLMTSDARYTPEGLGDVAENRCDGPVIESYPAAGALGTAWQNLKLSWVRHNDAVDYGLYFGKSPDTITLIEITHRTSFNLRSLKPEQNYYWRVDPYLQDGAIIEGEVWGFRTAGFLLLDDFESYLMAEDMADNWIWDGNRTALHTEQDIVCSGELSMSMTYSNRDQGDSSEAILDLAGPRDMTLDGGDTLSLMVRGHQKNDTQRLCVTLTDWNERSSTVEYPNRNIVRVTEWVEWLIPLRDFSPVDVGAITSICIGVDDRPLAFEIPIAFDIPIVSDISIGFESPIGNPPEIQTFSTPTARDYTALDHMGQAQTGQIYIDCMMVEFSGPDSTVGFWGHVRDDSSSHQAITGAMITFARADPLRMWTNAIPLPREPGEYLILVPPNQSYMVQVDAPGFERGTFMLTISADAKGKVSATISDLVSVGWEPVDTSVASCRVVGLDIYLTAPN